MRVIAGSARGTRLKVPKRLTRPSTDRLREALFSILGARVEGARVLDLFAGSGALGIEALSRGADRAVLVDASRHAAQAIEENLARAGFGDDSARALVVTRDVFAALPVMAECFDVIFADPPYASAAEHDLAARLLSEESLPGRLRADGFLILEVEAEREAPVASAWKLLDRRKYGSSAILFYGLGREA